MGSDKRTSTSNGSREMSIAVVLLTVFFFLVIVGQSLGNAIAKEEAIAAAAPSTTSVGTAKKKTATTSTQHQQRSVPVITTEDPDDVLQTPVPPSEIDDNTTPAPAEDSAGTGGGSVPANPAAGDHDASGTIDGKFTIVMLTYKAPKSLTTAVRSFIDRGLLSHPKLHEVLIYFQAFDKEKDVQLIDSITQDAHGATFRVIGDVRNLPVAQATFLAVRQVRTEHVLYLECDRPVYPFPKLEGAEAVTRHVHASMNEAIEFVSSGRADVYRLQLYAGPSVVEKKILPTNIYGTDAHKHCLATPSYNKGGADASNVCATAKRKQGNVFNTAYCKHWRKFGKEKPEKDLCDSFCFVDWSLLQDPSNFPVIDQSIVKRYVDGVEIGNTALTEHPNGEDGTKNASVTMCMSSGECNWTNQPTLYRKSWFLGAIAAPCEANPKKCMGSPGRMSAVRQEQFFVKNDRHWRMAKHKVCLSQGLFYHFEVDNRERES